MNENGNPWLNTVNEILIGAAEPAQPIPTQQPTIQDGNPWQQATPVENTAANPWDVPTAQPAPVELDDAQRDKLLADWQAAKDAVAKAKETEFALRKQVDALLIPSNKTSGTVRAPIGNYGWELKSVRKINYNVDKDIFEDTVRGHLRPATLKNALSITYKVKTAGYKQLKEAANDGDEVAIAELKLLATCVTSKQATPSVELEAPKVKK